MFILLIVINSYSIITGLLCLICLIFMFFESSFGICLGCLVYGWFYKEKAQYCPGEVCDVTQKQDIQKTSLVQIAIVIGFIGYFVCATLLLKDTFSQGPNDLWVILDSMMSQ